METVTIQDFIVYPENTTRKMIPDFPIHVTTILEMCRSTTVIDNAYPKTATIRNTVTMSGFQTGNVTEFVTPIMTLDGTQTIHRFLVYLAVGYQNFKANVDRAVKIYRVM